MADDLAKLRWTWAEVDNDAAEATAFVAAVESFAAASLTVASTVVA